MAIRVFFFLFSLLTLFYLLYRWKNSGTKLVLRLSFMLAWLIYFVLLIFPQLIEDFARKLSVEFTVDFSIVLIFFGSLVFNTYVYLRIKLIESRHDSLIQKISVEMFKKENNT
jgi:hypothetical protein